MKRNFDVIVYGATGFVGRQTARYIADHAAGLRWAIAGRSAAKLDALRRELGQTSPGIVVADAGDAAALDALAAQSRVVLSTAGPFARFGSGLVAACVRHGTHYVDITGETPWVRQMIDRHHAAAAKSGTRIVPGCGFDSVPSDLGAWLVASALWRQHGERCASVKACFSMRGGLNGGTAASALAALDDKAAQAQFDDAFLLNPRGTVPADAASHRDPAGALHDSDFDAWLAPFVMGPINSRVVRRSAALLAGSGPFAPDFRYRNTPASAAARVLRWRPARWRSGSPRVARRLPSRRCAGWPRASCRRPARGRRSGPWTAARFAANCLASASAERCSAAASPAAATRATAQRRSSSANRPWPWRSMPRACPAARNGAAC